MSVYSKFLSLVNGVPRTIDLSGNTLSVQGLQINAASGGGALTQLAHSATTSYSVVWPQTQAGGSNYALVNDGSGNLSWTSLSSGSVTSVALADGSSTPIYTISGSPVTSSGTLTFSLNTQSANTVFTGPSSGSAAQPGFRALVANDIPNLSGLYLSLSGGTMSGAINMGSNNITNLADPVNPQDAATKHYVDNAINGLDWKNPVQALAASNVPLTGSTPLTVDGYTVQNGDSLMLTNQTTAAQNGVYTVAIVTTTYTLTLRSDSATPAIGFAYLVLDGTQYADTAWVVNAISPNTTFVQFASAGEYTFNAPLAKTGTTVNLNYSNGLTVVSNYLQVQASDSSINSAAGGISVVEDPAGAIITGGSGIKVQLASSNPGLQISSNSLDVKYNPAGAIVASSSGIASQVLSTGGIQISSNSLALLLADTSLATNSSGVKVNLATSGALSVSSGLLVNTDGSSIDVNGSNQLEVKAQGISPAKLGAVAGNGLTGGSGSALAVLAASGGAISVSSSGISANVDGSTIDINGSNNLEVKAGGIGTTQLGTITDGVTLDQSGSGSTLEIKSGGVGTTQLANNAVTAAKIATSSFDQVTITGGNGTAASVAQAPSVQKILVAGQSFSANTSYIVRWGLNENSETTNRVYAADQDTSTYDEFWAIGVAFSSSSVSAGGNINVYMLGSYTLGSGDTTFATGDVGKPVYLTSSGAFSTTAPTSTGDAVFKIGNVESTTSLWINSQLIGVN